jgi:5-methylcytosine-specific restriction endonuclease McrA
MSWGTNRPKPGHVSRKRRAQVLAAQPLCICGDMATEVDHRTGRAEGGGNEPTNLDGLCSRCHRRKTNGYEPRFVRPPEAHPGSYRGAGQKSDAPLPATGGSGGYGGGNGSVQIG